MSKNGRCTNARKCSYYPSYSENFANVVAEAMAMACPVIITPEVGLAELVAEAGAGVVTLGEPRVFAEAVTKLHDNEFHRRRCGISGRRAALARLSWEGVAEQMEQEYYRILTVDASAPNVRRT